MSRLEPQQSAANTMIIAPNQPGWLPSLAARPPTMVPSRIAMNVAPSTSALPAGSSSFLRWSGRIPYLIGPNSVAITPNRNNVTNMIGIECSQKPTTPSADTAISTNFTRLATIDLSKRSASCPPKPERKKKGPMKMAAVSVISAARLPTPGANKIRNTSAFFRKLSLNAEKNWHQNKGAKRRDVIRLSDIGDSPQRPDGIRPGAWAKAAQTKSPARGRAFHLYVMRLIAAAQAVAPAPPKPSQAAIR